MKVKDENRIIQGGIIAFWLLFWLFNVIDKAIGGTTFLWVGKDRLAQFTTYFSSIGIQNPSVAAGFLVFVTLIETIALIYFGIALWHYSKKQNKKTKEFVHKAVFWGIFWTFFTFSFFTIGDQIFGDRFELLEHSIYWIATLMSWFIYTHLRKDI